MSSASERLAGLVKDGGLVQEMGFTGLEQHAGLINEEFLRKLQGRLGLLAFREMEANDPIAGAMLYALEMLCRSVNWTVEPFDDEAEDDPNAQFIEEIFDDMEYGWSDFIGEWMAAPTYGFAPFEICWKKRNGYNRDPALRSKYTDGKIGIQKLAIRHPCTLNNWVFDDKTGRLLAMDQLWEGKQARLPMEKLLLFTTLQRKGNPEGMSLLRRAFIPYFRKKHIEEVEGIGIERELAGMPMIECPPEWFMTSATPDERLLLEYMKKVVRRVKTDEQMGLVLPKMMDEQGHDLFKFSLVTSGGRRAIDTGPAKEYYSRQMAMSILMDVVMLGHEKVGSFALASSKTSLLGISIGALLDGIQDVMNRDLIPRVMELNGLPPEQSPRVQHGDIETPDLEILGTFVTALANAGLQLFPTKTGELERALLRAGNLPDDIADESPQRFDEAQQMQEAAAEAATIANEVALNPPAPGGGQPKGKEPVDKFDPGQPRDENGKWTEAGGRGSADDAEAEARHADKTAEGAMRHAERATGEGKFEEAERWTAQALQWRQLAQDIRRGMKKGRPDEPSLLGKLIDKLSFKQEAPVVKVDVAPPGVNVNMPAINVAPPAVTVTVPPQEQPGFGQRMLQAVTEMAKRPVDVKVSLPPRPKLEVRRDAEGKVTGLEDAGE